MLLRPVDASGDICPVHSSSDLLSGPEAVARLAALSAGGFGFITAVLLALTGLPEAEKEQN